MMNRATIQKRVPMTKFEFKELKTKSNDYIMDHLLYINIKCESKEEYLIIGFINNFIEIYNYNKKENKFEFIKYIFSSVKCIVYSMAFSLCISFLQRSSHLVVLSTDFCTYSCSAFADGHSSKAMAIVDPR